MNGCTLPSNCLNELAGRLRPDLFKALSDPTRLAILARLASSPVPLTVSEASQCCGVHFSGVSRHLKQLQDAGLVEATKKGREVVYRPLLAELTFTLRGLADAIEACMGKEGCCSTTMGDSDEDPRHSP